jgi:hypothetical protein
MNCVNSSGCTPNTRASFSNRPAFGIERPVSHELTAATLTFITLASFA